MSYPTEPDFVKVSVITGAAPGTETLLCGIENLTINQTANTSQRARRDCAKPGLPARMKNKVTSTQWDATGDGVWNLAQVPVIKGLLGIEATYKFEFGVRDGTDEGEIVGRYEGKGLLTGNSSTVGDEGTAQLTIAGNDDIVWTPAA